MFTGQDQDLQEADWGGRGDCCSELGQVPQGPAGAGGDRGARPHGWGSTLRRSHSPRFFPVLGNNNLSLFLLDIFKKQTKCNFFSSLNKMYPLQYFKINNLGEESFIVLSYYSWFAGLHRKINGSKYHRKGK